MSKEDKKQILWIQGITAVSKSFWFILSKAWYSSLDQWNRLCSKHTGSWQSYYASHDNTLIPSYWIMARVCVKVFRINPGLQHVQKWVPAIYFPQGLHKWLHSIDEKCKYAKYASQHKIHPDRCAVNSYCPIVQPKTEILSLFSQFNVIFAMFFFCRTQNWNICRISLILI